MPGVTYLACGPVKRLDSEREAATIYSVNQERSAGARAAPGPGRRGRWSELKASAQTPRAGPASSRGALVLPPFGEESGVTPEHLTKHFHRHPTTVRRAS